jgi:hypothetical protein
MACNCGTKEEIDRIYKIYGEKLNTFDDMTFWERIKHVFYVMFTILSWLIVFPFILIYLLLFLFWHEPGDRNINIQNFNLLKIFHLGKYARK